MTSHPNVLILLDSKPQFIEQLHHAGANEVLLGPSTEVAGVPVDRDLLNAADCLLCELLPSNFDECTTVKWIQLTSAGYSQIFGHSLVERGIRVTNGLGNFDIPMAEWNVMMMILWHRHLLEMLDNQKKASFDRAARFQSELRGSVVGFYGYGGMARETARQLRQMGLEIWTLTRNGKTKSRPLTYCVPGTGDPEGTLPHRVFSPDQKGEFLSVLDYLIMAMPITNATAGMMGETELKMLKPSAVLLNPARAGLIDEQSLIRCMKEQWIRGAAIDVHYAYPLPPEHPLWSLPNVVLTPHISGSSLSPHFQERIFDIFSNNLKRYCAGEPLLNELTPEQIQGN
ncbi:MAG: D-2-hydroxyacid dehydrogenase [Planctomycetota bacterium]|nr:D-2-hydroxyacid dehydrogenase [Planctomycetota bacterium]MDA1210866.1 D-2-hydroxyacid dehydrogenase [Planctomycetota bacterium]